jgi:hypothetical protein
VAAIYVPRSPTANVLYGVVRANLAALVAAVDAEFLAASTRLDAIQ